MKTYKLIKEEEVKKIVSELEEKHYIVLYRQTITDNYLTTSICLLENWGENEIYRSFIFQDERDLNEYPVSTCDIIKNNQNDVYNLYYYSSMEELNKAGWDMEYKHMKFHELKKWKRK